MTPTVDDLRNEIRQAVGRYERAEATAFTKGALAAICDAVGYDVDTTTGLPPKPRMRAGVLRKIGVLDEDDPDGIDRPFRKAELESIWPRFETSSERHGSRVADRYDDFRRLNAQVAAIVPGSGPRLRSWRSLVDPPFPALADDGTVSGEAFRGRDRYLVRHRSRNKVVFQEGDWPTRRYVRRGRQDGRAVPRTLLS